MMEFKMHSGELLMIYYPEMGYENIQKKIEDEDGINLKNTFWITKDNISNKLEVEEGGFCFKIGVLENGYYHLDKEVFATENNFYFSTEIEINQKFFVAYRNISIISKLDEIVKENIYITREENDKPGYIPLIEYKRLIKNFPNTTEVTKYAHARITQILSNYISESERINEKYEKYLLKKSDYSSNTIYPDLDLLSLNLFQTALDKMKTMLNKSEGYTEAEWQVAVHNIVCVLYPKYIMAKREVYIGDDGRHKKRPDFILVDSSGFVDILEIKKPQQQRLLTNRRYRDNYVPDRDLSGAIVQIEKYIYTLNQCGRKIEKEMNNKYSEDLPEGIQIRITNPQGMLLMGRSKNFSLEEKLDFEVIKRQYKNIVDIMTYDELIERFENIIRQLTKKC